MISLAALSMRTMRPRTPWPSIWKGCTKSLAGMNVPGSAISVMLEQAEAPIKNPLLGVEAILGFVPDHRLRAVDNTGRHLVAAMGRQAMHEDSTRIRLGHQRIVDLEAPQLLVTVDRVGIAHRDPGIGNDTIGALHGFRS